MLADIRRAIKRVHDMEVGDRVDGRDLQQAVQEAIREELDALSAQGQGSVREIVGAMVSSSGEDEPFGATAEMIVRLGRVRFDELEEGDEILGEGAFGVVRSGEYMGREVAIKKARGLIGDPAVLRDFRCAFWPISGNLFHLTAGMMCFWLSHSFRKSLYKYPT